MKKIETNNQYKAAIKTFYRLCHVFFNSTSIEELDRLIIDLLEILECCHSYRKGIMQLMNDMDDNPFTKEV